MLNRNRFFASYKANQSHKSNSRNHRWCALPVSLRATLLFLSCGLHNVCSVVGWAGRAPQAVYGVAGAERLMGPMPADAG